MTLLLAKFPRPQFFGVNLLDPELEARYAAAQALNTHLSSSTYEFGRIFEQFVVLEIIKANDAFAKGYELFYYRSDRGAEIDIIACQGNRTLAIEIKSATDPDITTVRRFKRLCQKIPSSEPYILCRTRQPSLVEGVHVLPWQQGIEELFS